MSNTFSHVSILPNTVSNYSYSILDNLMVFVNAIILAFNAKKCSKRFSIQWFKIQAEYRMHYNAFIKTSCHIANGILPDLTSEYDSKKMAWPEPKSSTGKPLIWELFIFFVRKKLLSLFKISFIGLILLYTKYSLKSSERLMGKFNAGN